MDKICFFNSSIEWGGGEKWHYDTANYLHEHHHPVLVICHPKSQLSIRLRKTDIPHLNVSVKNLSFLNPVATKTLSNIFINEKVHTLVLNLSRDLKFGGIAAKKAGVSRIIYRRGSAIPIANTLLNRYLFRSVVDDVLVNSKATAKTVLQKNSKLFPEEKIKIIPNSIDLKRYTTSTELLYKKEAEELILVSMGRLEREKNHQFLLEVAKVLVQREIPFKLLIGGSGSLYQKLKSQIKDLELTDHVKLLGFIEEPQRLLQAGDVFLLPSLWEGFGYVLAEAGACRLPVVAFNTGSIPEIVQEGKTGFLTDMGDGKTFSEAIIKLYQEPELRESMGSQAYDFIAANYSEDRVNDVLTKYVES